MAFSTVVEDKLHLTLDRYCKIMRLAPYGFNGLENPYEANMGYACDAVWTQADRDGVALALKQAEEMRIRELGYFLSHTFFVETLPYKNPLILTRKHLVRLAALVTETLEYDFPLDLSTLADTYTLIVPISTDISDSNDIHLYFTEDDGGYEVYPLSVKLKSSISLGYYAEIVLHRATLAKPGLPENPKPQYDDNSNFVAELDITREYYEPCEAVYYVWSGSDCNCNSLADTEHIAYGRIGNARLSIIEHVEADCDNGTFTQVCNHHCRQPDSIRVQYVSGVQNNTYTELCTARLAHTLFSVYIPNGQAICGNCWQSDNEVVENIFTPYGSKRGAVDCWMADNRARVGNFGGMLR